MQETRCSSGVIPCEACIKRGKPEDCKWETGGGEVRAEHTFALASDLDALRAQVQDLAGFVYNRDPASAPPRPPLPPPHRPTSLSTRNPSVPTNSTPWNPSNTNTNNNSAAAAIRDDVESAVTNLEHLTEHLPSHGGGSLRSSSNHASPYAQTTHHSPIYSLVPEEVAGRRLSSLYLMGPYHAGWHVLHGPSFGAELKTFYRLDPATRRAETDPAWLAIFLMVLVFGLQDATPTEASALFPHLAPIEIPRLPSALYSASRFALDVAKWDSVPQIRHIQCVLLYFPFLYHFGFSSEDMNQSYHHIASAISSAQWLGLDRLGPDGSGTPLHDPAFTNLSPSLAFELCKRIYHSLSFLDGTTSKRQSLARLTEQPGVTTPLPGNLSDEDLMMDPVPRGRSSEELTAALVPRVGSLFATSIRTFLGQNEEGDARLFSDETQGDGLSWEDIQKYDASLRTVLESMPTPLRPTNTTDGGHLLTDSSINWMHCCLWTSVHNRILRLHRPGLARNFSTEAYEISKSASLASAKEIVATQRVMMACPHLRPGFIKRWVLGAALVLTVDLVISIDAGHDPHTVIASKRLDVAQALEIFEQDNPLDRSPAVTQRCARTIDALLLACHHRMNARQAGVAPVEGEGLQAFFEGVASAISSPADSNGQPAADPSSSTSHSNGNGNTPAPLDAYEPAPTPDFSGFDFSFEGLMRQDTTGLLESTPASSFDFGFYGGWENFGNGNAGQQQQMGTGTVGLQNGSGRG
ncbi:hypothetical protein RQP46_011169 [Phenoliferia psychrophenolica]